jgi:glutamate-1-semialdehyde aminotransferase
MTPENRALFQRSLEKIPWATQTNAKRHDSDGATTRPPFIQRAKGCRMWDIDDREYMDTLDRTTITTTYAGETLFLAAAKTVMEIMNREPVVEHLFAMGERLRSGFEVNICALCLPPRGKPSTPSTADKPRRGITATKRFALRGLMFRA